MLPGAFSAYRYESLRHGRTPTREGDALSKYFASLNKPLGPKYKEGALGPLKGNMFLAEDRILVFELLSRPKQDFFLRYVSSSPAWTDPVNTLEALLKQRRRWSNGSFFAMLFTFQALPRFWLQSGHSILRKGLISILFIYYIVMNLVQWFTLALFYLCFKFIAAGTCHEVFAHFDSVYYSLLAFQCIDLLILGVITVQFVTGLGNKPGYQDISGLNGGDNQWKTLAVYVVCAQLLGLVMFLMFVSAFYQLLVMWRLPGTDPDALSDWQKALAVLTLGSPFVAALLHKRLCPLLLGFPKYLVCLPVFSIMVPIFSFCNMHDISWGTKGLDQVVVAQIQQDTQNKLHRVSNRTSIAPVDGTMVGPVPPPPMRGRMSTATNIGATKGELRERREIKEQGKTAEEQVKKDRDLTDEEFREFRTWLVAAWICSNALIVLVLGRECDEEAVYNAAFDATSWLDNGRMLANIPGLCASTVVQSTTEMARSFTKCVLVLAGAINTFRFMGSCYFLLVDKLERWLARSTQFLLPPCICAVLPCIPASIRASFEAPAGGIDSQVEPHFRRCLVGVGGLILLLVGVATAPLPVLMRMRHDEEEERQDAGGAPGSTGMRGTFDELDSKGFFLVLFMGCVALLGCLCVLATVGARSRFSPSYTTSRRYQSQRSLQSPTADTMSWIGEQIFPETDRRKR
eukprot:COSAG01_NODE_2202_length_8174_cov_44.528050_4_plen_686_part_00